MNTELKKLNVINLKNEVLSQIEVPGALFNVAFDVAFFSNFHVKDRKRYHKIRAVRKERISGGGKKPYKQKGTGNARCGSTRALSRVGGLTFGSSNPERSKCKVGKREIFYAKSMLLSLKLQSNELFILNCASFDFHSTKRALEVFDSFGKEKSFLVIHDDNISTNTLLAVRNLNVYYVSFDMLTVHDLFKCNNVLMTVNAVNRFSNAYERKF